MRDELEHLLDDDEDMAEMYLTDKFIQQQLESASSSSMNDREDVDDEVNREDMNLRHVGCNHHFHLYMSFSSS